ncbi:SanA/YdcF family protein [Paractinoplanes rishiriensis]|uniref:Membrane protein n=1 Tax=Paractinoplanes rishiriensis TaxID=1050105 RepID=A0A919JP49_9ACTN|nr:ElyC/SanA/YdcF family protein [Actinoplanes rishiriensis]GIE92581.1 membrane protein [Actinoplanes rishiriensis]
MTRAGIVGAVPIAILVRAAVRRLVTAGALLVALAVLAMAGGALWTRGVSHGHVYDESTVPAAPVALVLGAQVYPDGTPSAYLAARLDLAKRLLDAGKVRAILLSGDHSRWEYDEPGAMQVYLIARGVPASQLVLDYAGFDTYDSCARARRIFGVRQAVVVTQTFHLDRAVALCRSLGVDATGVGDDSVRWMTAIWQRNLVRERLAVVKALADVASRRDPVFLGRYETGVDDALRAG